MLRKLTSIFLLVFAFCASTTGAPAGKPLPAAGKNELRASRPPFGTAILDHSSYGHTVSEAPVKPATPLLGVLSSPGAVDYDAGYARHDDLTSDYHSGDFISRILFPFHVFW